jgi:hypothetical protein
MTTTTYTENEMFIITGIPAAKFGFFDDGITEGSNTWIDCLCEEAGDPKTFRGVISSLIKKGFFDSDGESVYLTAEAVNIINGL